MRIFKYTFLVLLTALLIFNTSPASAHFVKSDAGIGAVLHVDPGDDPVAGEPSNIILEYKQSLPAGAGKDTNNKFDLSKCDCRLSVTKEGQEVLSEMIHPVAPDQKLSSVTPIIFPEKNIYKLKITGTSATGEFPDFELNYDVRVANESNKAEVAAKEDNWFVDHVIHLVGGGLIVALLLGAFISQKKKLAVIILVLLILGHSLPVKAIHASHDGPVDSGSFACCLPTAAIVPDVALDLELPEFSDAVPVIDEQSFNQEIGLKYFIRPPPLS